MADATVTAGAACGGGTCLGVVIFLIVVFASIKRVGPEEQIVWTRYEGKDAKNGPFTMVVWPHEIVEYRKATRLGPREYAIVKGQRTGVIRHEVGPQLLFIGAYDDLIEVKPKVVLQKTDYVRLVDTLTGTERVIKGPLTLVPEPLEEAKAGVEQAVVVGAETSVLTKNKTSGVKEVVTEEGVFVPEPYQVILEVRKATLLNQFQFASVKNHLTGVTINTAGPLLLKLGPYDELLKVAEKIVLQKTEYMRLLDDKTGQERVVEGPMTFIPLPSENSKEGKQQKVVLQKDEYIRFVDAKTGTERILTGPLTTVPSSSETSPEGAQSSVFLNAETAVLVMNRSTGQQRLIESNEVFTPAPYEAIIEVRNKIRVLQHEALVVRNGTGGLKTYLGREESSFFLQPYNEIVAFDWTTYDDAQSAVEGKKESITKIDLRAKKMFFDFEVRTSDNVKLRLAGTIFWQVINVGNMVAMTSDPQGDVWHHARSALIGAISQVTLNNFMENFNNITMQAFEGDRSDSFYTDRGVEVQSMELTDFDCVDAETAAILQEIIKETTNRINRLAEQEGENAVNVAALTANIDLEKQKKSLIVAQKSNKQLEAKIIGVSDGTKLVERAATFIGGLNESLPNITSRVDLYKLHETMTARNKDTLNLASGNAKLFLTPTDLNLRLDMSGASGPEL